VTEYSGSTKEEHLAQLGREVTEGFPEEVAFHSCPKKYSSQ
jgi:hypothetical protein